MNNDKNSANLIGIMPEKEPELVGFITPAVAYIIPVPEVPSYEGPFIFTPSDNKYIIRVGGHIVKDDITINEIPYAEVSNPNGGYTVTIGE